MSEPYVGEIRMFAGTFAPADWNFCDGSLLSISDYDTLYTLIGTTYGGDGQNTFAVPDLRGRLPVHAGQNAGTSYVLGQSGGTESVTLNTNQLPAHTHSFGASSSAGATMTPTNAVLGSGTQIYFANSPGVAMGAMLTPQGGSQPHDNVMPFLAVNFIISLFGIFPTQS